MKKTLGAFFAVAILLSAWFMPQAAADAAIRIFIDGDELATDQPPILVQSRVLVPMRSIFEALDASVAWNSRTQTVTATKGAVTVVLKIGSQTASINNRTVTLDVPAQMRNNRTMVPIRFVTEALGDDVKWNSSIQSVLITTRASKQVTGAMYVSASNSGQFGDGRDLKISFAPPQESAYVQQYRILAVKAANADSFTLEKALAVAAGNYTPVPASYSGHSIALNAQTRDVDGTLLRTDQLYRIFILTIGEENSVLSAPSAAVELRDTTRLDAATNVKISDVNDFGDGRDVSISFTRANNEDHLSHYRVFIVRSAEAAKFNLDAANRATSHYTTVYRTGSNTVTTMLSSTARDTSGQLLQNGVPYTAFVLSVAGSSAHKNSLSAASPSVTLSSTIVPPIITSVSDIANHGNGSDLQISFNRAPNETLVNHYRIFAVPENEAASFDASAAGKVSSSRYTAVAKTGSNVTMTLSSRARDTRGNTIKNGVAYRIFVMAVSSDKSVSSALSAPSLTIALSNSGVNPATNITVRDVSDYNSGQDLHVSFSRASNENNIGYYRIFVVKADDLHAFNYTAAVSSSNSNIGNYTTVYKTGRNIATTLPHDARDWTGALIQNGIQYHVFVLSVGIGSTNGHYALSAQSAAITLKGAVLPAVTNVKASDTGDSGNGQDLRVAFNRPGDESRIQLYRIFVVRSESADSFTLASANAITDSKLYTTVGKTGSNISMTLPAHSTDIHGVPIQNGISYRVFVMSLGDGTSSLSAPSPSVTLTTASVPAVTNVTVSDAGDHGNGLDLQVTFTRPASESLINHYRIYVVNPAITNHFDLQSALSAKHYTLAPVGSSKATLDADARDVSGAPIRNGVNYQVFVLSAGNHFSASALSNASNTIVLRTDLTAPAVTATQVGRDAIINVSIANDNAQGISGYAILVMNTSAPLTVEEANFLLTAPGKITTNIATSINHIHLNRDIDNAPLSYDTTYYVYVLAIANNGWTGSNVLSAPGVVTLTKE